MPRTLGYDLVWDDTLLIQQSWRLHHWHALPSLLTSHFWSEVGEASHYYRPLVTLTFFLDVQSWGLHPLGFHLTNVLAHAAVTLAVLAVARRTLDGEPAAAICALVFALHPLHTESVSFVSGRTDVLATLFFLLALLAYDRGRARGAVGTDRLVARRLPARAARQGSGDHVAGRADPLGPARAGRSPGPWGRMAGRAPLCRVRRGDRALSRPAAVRAGRPRVRAGTRGAPSSPGP